MEENELKHTFVHLKDHAQEKKWLSWQTQPWPINWAAAHLSAYSCKNPFFYSILSMLISPSLHVAEVCDSLFPAVSGEGTPWGEAGARQTLLRSVSVPCVQSPGCSDHRHHSDYTHQNESDLNRDTNMLCGFSGPIEWQRGRGGHTIVWWSRVAQYILTVSRYVDTDSRYVDICNDNKCSIQWKSVWELMI